MIWVPRRLHYKRNPRNLSWTMTSALQTTKINTTLLCILQYFSWKSFWHGGFGDWLIDWLDDVLRLIGNISAIKRRRQLIKSDQFWNFQVSLAALTTHFFIDIQWNGIHRAGCYSWHWAPFNVPSDRHILVKRIQHSSRRSNMKPGDKALVSQDLL